MKEIRTRFAPSPTGYLHIGGVRTALYAWLTARKAGGKFFLRIEDTDRTRFVEDAVDAIKDGLSWIGFDWDGDIVFQSERLEKYKATADQLIEEGRAYRCFCTEARLDRVRKLRMQNSMPSGYDRKCRNLSKEEIDENLAAGTPYVVRLKVPEEGETVCQDLLRGEIRFPNQTLEDIVLLKTDGFPTYHLAHVVDDHEMEITHIHRGEEWIPSLPVHVILFNYLGYELPIYVHLPVILSTSGKKLSKREGSVALSEYIAKGYLRDALVNYLALVGWSYDDQKQIFSRKELVELFDIAKVSRSSGIFDPEKLNWFNGWYIRELPPDSLYDVALPWFAKAGFVGETPTTDEEAYVRKILPQIRERIVTLGDIPEYCKFFFKRPETYVTEDFLDKKRDAALCRTVLEALLPLLEASGFSETELEETLKKYVETSGIKVKDIFMPTRVAVCGTKFSPGLFETLAIIGKEESIARINNARAFLKDK